MRCFPRPDFFLKFMNIFELPATNKEEVDMLVYKGVLHLPYGGGNGESFNSLPLVSEKREDYEAPSDEMRLEA